MTSMSAETTVRKQRVIGRPFVRGQSGNPAGRPRGSRHRHAECFLAAFSSDFERHGPAVIEQVRHTMPHIYLKIASDLLPKESVLDVDISIHDQVIDLLHAFRDLNGGRVDRELEKMAKRLLPSVIHVEPERD